MTGFGAAEGKVLGGRLRVEIRTVNHRYFNPQLKLPGDLAGIEGDLRERLRETLGRGHVAVTARWIEAPQSASAVSLDLDRARQVVGALKQLKKKLRLKGDPDLSLVARQAEVISVSGAGEQAVGWNDARPVFEQAESQVLAMREREGAALARDLKGRLEALEAAVRTIAARAPERLVTERDRLQKSVAELAGGLRIDEQRLAQEIALLADRLDIAEELVRFRTHLEACRAALADGRPGAAGGGGVGKQLGFLAQELLRETNTIGAKANDAQIAQVVIGMKGELERFREQLENLE
ncbi:MAG TPA: YicC/YloC family endoribonuclease [Gemmatimonadales bacterium]|nr:YicC/YloC family endoribonuclease [Gemmatimonadales bacterium]